ncbi:MAG: hypothetical protein OEW91_11265, partial [Acidimicrobiia bacterium]|nr:hypothetical protein [Acidimicrobiia bacterium]
WVGESIGHGPDPAWHFCIVDFYARVIEGVPAAGDDAADLRWVDERQARALDLVPTMPSLLDIVFAA